MRKFFTAWSVSLVPLLASLAYVALARPEFFLQDDKQAQYAPTYHFIGRELLAGRLPVLVPEMGTAGNLLLDSQYGLTNPIYWLQNIIFSGFDNLALATLVMAGAYLLTLQAGAVAWILRLTDNVAWSAIGGAAAWLSGYTLWWAATAWHPALASVAFLPWLGWALAKRQTNAVGVLLIAATTFATIAGGWPFTAVAAAVLCVVSLVEILLLRGRRDALVTAFAIAGGVLFATPAYWFTGFALDWTTRKQGLANGNFLVPNFLDVANTGIAGASANMVTFGANVTNAPILLAGGLSVALLFLLDFGRWDWKRPGVITVTVTSGLFLLGTQGPSDVGPLKFPFRMLGPWQVLLVVALCVIAATLGLKLTRVRVLGATATLGLFAAIAVFRVPADVVQILQAALLALLLMGVIVWGLREGSSALQALPAAVVITMIAIWSFWSYPSNANIAVWNLPDRVSDYQQPLGEAQRTLVLYPPDDGAPQALRRFAEQGVYLGQNYLLSPARSGLGYTPVGQKYLQPAMCTTVWGFTCPSGLTFLSSVEPTTGQRWLDLLGTQTLVVHKSFVEGLEAALVEPWELQSSTKDFEVYQRAVPALPGRISYIEQPSQVQLQSSSPLRQTYTVDAGRDARRIVFSDVFWPGYSATFDGRPLPVEALANSLVSVVLPEQEGVLVVSYTPAGSRSAALLLLGGLATLVFAVVLAQKGQGRQAREPAQTPVGGESDA